MEFCYFQLRNLEKVILDIIVNFENSFTYEIKILVIRLENKTFSLLFIYKTYCDDEIWLFSPFIVLSFGRKYNSVYSIMKDRDQSFHETKIRDNLMVKLCKRQ